MHSWKSDAVRSGKIEAFSIGIYLRTLEEDIYLSPQGRTSLSSETVSRPKTRYRDL